jgi:hypothetical protein
VPEPEILHGLIKVRGGTRRIFKDHPAIAGNMSFQEIGGFTTKRRRHGEELTAEDGGGHRARGELDIEVSNWLEIPSFKGSPCHILNGSAPLCVLRGKNQR